MTPEERQAARARCETATPGRWQAKLGRAQEEYFSRFWRIEPQPSEPGTCVSLVFASEPEDDDPADRQDAEFIAQARTDLPRALDEIDRLEACLLSLRGQIMAYEDDR